ncbi:MAG TPA: Rrf2 family transcriptional regulator [Selenomonadales bacterium]|nr:Rrf2 family transcriptional regulator [Selenomonadales bacterium]
MVRLLTEKATSYAQPMTSKEIGEILKVTPSYVRAQLSMLVKDCRVRVRRGNGGGYYVIREDAYRHGKHS